MEDLVKVIQRGKRTRLELDFVGSVPAGGARLASKLMDRQRRASAEVKRQRDLTKEDAANAQE